MRFCSYPDVAMDGADMSRLLRFLATGTVTIIFLWIFIASLNKPRILLLHSLSEDSIWTIKAQQGVHEVLAANRRPISVSHHYMDLDQKGPTISERTAIASARRAIDRINPDILIVFGDQSNELVVSKMHPNERPAIVYSAILAPQQDYGYTYQQRATGVEEIFPVHALLDLFEALMPGKPLNIAVIGVDGVTNPVELNLFMSGSLGKHKVIAGELVNTIEQWRRFVLQDAEQADMLLVLDSRMVEDETNKSFMPEAQVITWTQLNAKPLPVGLDVSYAANGGALAVTVQPSQYGKAAMEIALDWLDRGKRSMPPKRMTLSSYTWTIRQAELQARGLTLPNLYLDFARSTGGLYP